METYPKNPTTNPIRTQDVRHEHLFGLVEEI